MAINKQSLVGTKQTSTEETRFFAYEDGVLPGLLNPIAGAPDLPHLTPLTYNAGAYDVWVDLGDIDALLYQPRGQASHAVDQVVISLGKRGRVSAPAVPLPTTAGQTQGALDTALKATELRQKGITVTEIDGVA